MNKLFLTILFLLMCSFNGHSQENWNYLPSGSPAALNVASSGTEDFIIVELYRGGVWKSLDGGNSWQMIDSELFGEDRGYLNDIIFVGSTGDTIILNNSRESNIIYSLNNGNSWNELTEDFINVGQKILKVDPYDHNHLLYAEYEIFAESFDFGQSWTYSEIDGWNIDRMGMDMDFSNEKIILTSPYMHTQDTEIGGVYIRDFASDGWTPVVSFYDLWNSEFIGLGIPLVLSNGDWLIPVTTGWESYSFIKSSNQGQDWEIIGSGLPVRFQARKVLEDTEVPGRLYAINDQKYGLYVSNNFGDNWERCFNGLPENVSFTLDLEINPYSNNIYLGIRGEGLFNSSDSGQNWDRINLPEIGTHGFLSIFEDKIFYRDSAFRLWEITDDDNLIEKEVPHISPDTLTMFRPIVIKSGDTLVASITRRPVIQDTAINLFSMTYSYDNGNSWNLGPNMEYFSPTLFKARQYENYYRILARTGSVSWGYSDDLGISWNDLDCFGQPILNCEMAENRIYCQTNNFIYYTEDNGENWNDTDFDYYQNSVFLDSYANNLFISSDIAGQEVFCTYINDEWDIRGTIPEMVNRGSIIPLDNDTLFLACAWWGNKLFKSSDIGHTWEEVAIEMPFELERFGIEELYYDEFRQRIWLTMGAGIVYAPVEDFSSAENRVEFVLPAEFELNAYPNPFNSTTKINFILPETGNVKVSVYDINGRHVQTIIDKHLQSGIYSEYFEPDNLASGTYFIHLNTPAKQLTKKIVYVK